MVQSKATVPYSLPVQIGMPVEMATRKIRTDDDAAGIIVYGYKFRPLLATAA